MRERQRMGEINVAFENLRERLPALAAATPATDSAGGSKCEKLTKINILHMTITYINALKNIIETGDAGINVYRTAVVQSPLIPLPAVPQPANNSAPNSPPSSGSNNNNGSKKKKSKKPSLPSCIQTSLEKSGSRERSTSGSGDSGIMEDEETTSSTSFIECPDWTELTSTLQFPPVDTQLPPVVKEEPQQQLQQSVLARDTLLAISSLLPTAPLKEADVFKSTTNSSSTYNSSKMLFGRQTSFPDLAEDAADLLSDLNSSFESLDTMAAVDINFIHEDPFQMMIF